MSRRHRVEDTELTRRPGSSHRTFIYDSPDDDRTDGPEEQAITLVEEMAAIQAGTTGLRTWTAAYVSSLCSSLHPPYKDRLHLAHHILRDSSILGCTSGGRIPPILELGAGTGFLSIFLAKLGAEVITSDLGAEEDEDVDTIRRTPLARLRQNVNLSQ